MNAEELKQLKKGDEIFIRARFVNVLGDGDVMFSHSATNAYDKVVREESFTHPKNVILFTPAAELEPYSVHESEAIQGFDIVRDELCVMTFPFGAKERRWYYNELAAKEAAEEECKRLNEEYRKGVEK